MNYGSKCNARKSPWHLGLEGDDRVLIMSASCILPKTKQEQLLNKLENVHVSQQFYS